MSLIIKGMKLPGSCDNCDLIQFDGEGLEAHCPLAPYYRWCGTPPDYRPEGCPLVEVPAPHGRLIDADRLKRVMEYNHCKRCDNYNGARCSACWVDDCFSYIDDFPAIIEAEVSE